MAERDLLRQRARAARPGVQTASRRSPTWRRGGRTASRLRESFQVSAGRSLRARHGFYPWPICLKQPVRRLFEALEIEVAALVSPTRVVLDEITSFLLVESVP